MKHRKKTIILLLIMALTLFSSVVFSPTAVSEANSAPRETKGYDSSGVIVKTENSPIVVDKEDLTFHIYSADRFIPVQEYVRRGTVTAEYTFRNPTNLTVETRCLFPFGFVPYDESQTEADKEYFKVKTNGKDLDKTIRHTYKADPFAKFDLEEDLRYFSDDFIADDTLSTDLMVYEYVLDIKGANGKLPTYVKFSDNVKNLKYIVFDNYVKYEKNGDITDLVARQDGLKGGQLTLAFVGKDVADIESKFSFFDDKWKSVGGSVVKGKKVEYNFKDYALKFRPAGSDVSDVDWYNATVALIKKQNVDGVSSVGTFVKHALVPLVRLHSYVRAGRNACQHCIRAALSVGKPQLRAAGVFVHLSFKSRGGLGGLQQPYDTDIYGHVLIKGRNAKERDESGRLGYHNGGNRRLRKERRGLRGAF
ncbi:MAG: hypothetical protein L6V85_01450 [Clostridiales bacterium]|nr:MAG: hypothetical protein L6V85_01450 [Clostridiales bacterium]